jgi:hypothetical protein
MRMRCSDFLEAITELAFGNESADASLHVDGCPRCAGKLDELRRIANALNVEFIDAPQVVVDRAVEIGAPARRLPLVRSSLAGASARSAAVESFQRVFDAVGFEVRVMYSKSETGWSVMIDTDPRVVVKTDFENIVSGSDGNYEFVADSLEQTGFSLDAGSLSARVPAGSEQLEDDELA